MKLRITFLKDVISSVTTDSNFIINIAHVAMGAKVRARYLCVTVGLVPIFLLLGLAYISKISFSSSSY